MGYYSKLNPPILPVSAAKLQELRVAALLKFTLLHTLESEAVVEANFKLETVKVSAGETETFTFEELGFSI